MEQPARYATVLIVVKPDRGERKRHLDLACLVHRQICAIFLKSLVYVRPK